MPSSFLYLHELNTKDITYLKAELNRIESFYPIELSFRYDTFPRNISSTVRTSNSMVLISFFVCATFFGICLISLCNIKLVKTLSD